MSFKRDEFENLAQRAKSSQSLSARLDVLDFAKLHSLQYPRVVFEEGAKLLKNGGLGDRRWDVLEQVAVAALDEGRIDYASSCLESLQTRFPESQRVCRLQGMYFEAKGMYDEALKLYESMLEENPANMLAMKRKVCVLKGTGKIGEAIAELSSMLEIFSTDLESWKELVNLHVSVGDYKRALFCQEDVILADAHNYQNHNRYADLLYTVGGEVNVRAARRHYAQSLELNPKNARAAYGLCLASHMLATRYPFQRGKASVNNVAGDESELNQKLFQKGANLLRELHGQASALLGPLEKMLASLEGKK